MKPSYQGFESKKTGGFVELPPVGAYVAEIMDVRFVQADGETQQRDVIEMMIEITEGEYKDRYHKVYEDQKERFGNARYRGTFRLTPPIDGDEDWRKRIFEGNLWCVEQCNPGYTWDWDENKLKGKKIGINVRRKLYNYTDNKTGETKEAETTEIGKFETISDVQAWKCKAMRDNDRRTVKVESTDGQEFTDVSAAVSVPW